MSIDGRIIMDSKNLSPELSIAEYGDVGARVFYVQSYANNYQLTNTSNSVTPYNNVLRGGTWGYFCLHPVDWGSTNTFKLTPYWVSNYDNGVFWPILIITLTGNHNTANFEVRNIDEQTDIITLSVDNNRSYLIFNGAPVGSS